VKPERRLKLSRERKAKGSEVSVVEIKASENEKNNANKSQTRKSEKKSRGKLERFSFVCQVKRSEMT
jgi:hypothetical protein